MFVCSARSQPGPGLLIKQFLGTGFNGCFAVVFPAVVIVGQQFVQGAGENLPALHEGRLGIFNYYHPTTNAEQTGRPI